MLTKEKILIHLKEAMKSGNADRVGLLRLLQSAIHNKEIEKRTKEKSMVDLELTEEEVLQLLNTETKKRRESIEIFNKGGRRDLAEKEERELIFTLEYLPKQLSAEEAGKIVDEIVGENPGKDFGALMKLVMAELRGKADAKMISEMVKKKLSQ